MRVPPPSAWSYKRRRLVFCGRFQENQVRAQHDAGPALAILSRDVDRARGGDAGEVLLAGLGLAFGGGGVRGGVRVTENETPIFLGSVIEI